MAIASTAASTATTSNASTKTRRTTRTRRFFSAGRRLAPVQTRALLHGPASLLCQGGVRFQCVEDDANEESLQTANRFAPAFPLSAFALEVGARAGVVARL